MKSLFQFKCACERVGDDGKVKNVTEVYLVDAVSFTEAEARAIQLMGAYCKGDFAIKDIKQVSYSDVWDDVENGYFFKMKVQYITLNEKGNGKVTVVDKLVLAPILEDAIELLYEKMKGTLTDWRLVAVVETPIMGYFKH